MLILLASLSFVQTLVHAEQRVPIAIESAKTHLVEGVYLLDAQINFQFTAATLEALHNGVPLTIEVQIQVQRERNYVWSEDIASLAQRYQISYHALAQRYVISNMNSGTQRSFVSWDATLQNLSYLRGYPMLDRSLIDANEIYQARIRARLDIEALPLPLRPVAYLSPQWRLVSDWFTWHLDS